MLLANSKQHFYNIKEKRLLKCKILDSQSFLLKMLDEITLIRYNKKQEYKHMFVF